MPALTGQSAESWLLRQAPCVIPSGANSIRRATLLSDTENLFSILKVEHGIREELFYGLQAVLNADQVPEGSSALLPQW